MNSNWQSSIDSLISFISAVSIYKILLIHFIASILIALVVWLMLPKKYKYPAHYSLLFLLSITLFMPVVGAIGLVTCILFGLHFPRRRKARILDVQESIELPYRQLIKLDSTLFHDGGLEDVLSLQVSEEKRLKALLAMRNMHKQDAIPILKKVLRDPADDIRLLAYAMLDKYETQINTELENVLSQLPTAQGAHRAELHRQIASNYWELAYLGLAQGAVLEHILQQAQNNIEQAMAFKETPELALLAGRIALKQNRGEHAALAFQQALVLGMEKQHVVPYLAQAAYVAGRYQDIPKLLAELPEALAQRYPFDELMGYWHANAKNL